jgi:uncharacterized protein YkwD
MRLPRPRTILLALSMLALAVPAASAAAAPGSAPVRAPASASKLDSLERGVVAEMNALRRRHGLPALRASAPLSEAAVAHSTAMARSGFFSHTSTDGTAFWKRVQRFYGPSGFGYWSVGENLLWSSPTVDARRAVQMWLDSPPHRKNMLTAAWREVGLAAVTVDAAPGVFNGLPVTIVTADFGVRR